MRTKTVHRCTECGRETPRWLGRCPACEAWGSLVEETVAPRATATVVGAAAARDAPVPLCEVNTATGTARATGVGELDRVLGGGLVPGSVALLAGEPGTGKSPLLFQELGSMSDGGARCLLVTA